jgi:tetratricopeptide (TPR) repeat protein
MVIRHLGKDSVERIENIEDSISKAKEAVQLDITDGTSWFVLGNAYVTQYFMTNQSPVSLKQCLAAYQQAERDIVATCNPDLHYNRATVYQHQEDYELALIGYARAIALDPTFSEPKEKLEQLAQYLNRCSELTLAKGKLRPKKLQSLVNSIDDKTNLGPYSSGTYTAPNGKTARLEAVLLNQLQPGANPEKVILGKVVCSVNEGPTAISFTFCMVDKTSTCFRVTVYNIANGWGIKIGDCVAIPEPFVNNIELNHFDQHIKFPSIRVHSPIVLVVNGRKLSKDSQSPSVVSMQARSE